MNEEQRNRVAQQVARLAAGTDDAVRARELLERERFATLCTNAIDYPGFPFGSVVAYVLEESGNVIIQASTLAEHTRNFTADPRAALFVRLSDPVGADPQTLPRVTVLGRLESVPAGEDAESLFLEVHPRAKNYARMGDFAFYRLTVHAIRYIGGFGSMSWLDGETGTNP